MTTSPAFTFEALDANGNVAIKIYVFAKEEKGGVTFSFVTEKQDGYEDWRIDLNGFFLDTGNEGGAVTSVEGSKANNMKGGNNDGYDYAVGLGSVGGKDEDWTSGDIFIAGLTLESLMGADAGLRATSYGPNGEGSLKLVADYTPPEGPPPGGEHFPEYPISNVVFYFKADGDLDPNGDVKPTGGDGWYVVKFDVAAGATVSPDLDDWYQDAWDWLIANDAYVTADTELVGVAIKGGTKQTLFYAIDGEEDPEPIPAGAPGIETPPKQGNVDGTLIDQTYSVSMIGTDYVFS